MMAPPCMGMFAGGERRLQVAERRRSEQLDYSSSSSSSIGRNSDVSGCGGADSGEDGGESEVQSSYKGPLDTMDALEEVLPIKKGISKFYNGKSKSFTSLVDASSASSIKDLAKPEIPYTRKRKNLLANGIFWDKNCSYPRKDGGNGISKRPANSNKSTSALGLTMSGSKSNNNIEDSRSILPPPSCLPPLHPHGKRSPSNGLWSSPHRWNHPCRSFSLSDLECAAAATSNN